MPDQTEEVNFEIDVGGDFSDVLGQVARLDEEFESVSNRLSKLDTESPTEGMKEMVQMSSSLSGLMSDINRKFDTSHEAIEPITDALQKYQDELQEVRRIQEELAKEDIVKERQEALKEQLKQRKQNLQEANQMAIDNIRERKGAFKSAMEDMSVVGTLGLDDLGEATSEAVSNSLTAAFQSQDAEAAMTGLAEPFEEKLGEYLQGVGGEAGGMMAGEPDESMFGGDGGGGGGTPSGLMGGGKQMLSKLTGMIGNLTASIGLISGMITAFVAMEDQIKDINESLFESVSMAEMMNNRFIDANDTLKMVQNVVTDASLNLSLAMDKEKQLEMIGALKEHGLEMEELTSRYANARRSMRETIKDMRVSVMNLNVDTKEMAQFIGTMTETHGRNLDQVLQSTEQIEAAAEDSTASYNKFFSTINSISSELSLHNFRLMETTDLLAQMNKYLNFENAQKFTKEMVTRAKEMTQEEAIRQQVLVGQKKAMGDVRKQIRMTLERLQGRGGMVDAFETITGKSVKGIDQMLQETKDMTTGELSQVIQGIPEQMAPGRPQEQEDIRKNLQRALVTFQQASGNVMQQADAYRRMITGSPQTQLAHITESLEENYDQSILTMSSKMADEFADISRETFRMYKQLYADVSASMQDIRGGDNLGSVVRDLRDKGFNVRLEDGEIIGNDTEEAIKNEADLMENLDKKQNIVEKLNQDQMSAAQRQAQATQTVKDILSKNITELLNDIAYNVGDISSWIQDWFMEDTEDAVSDRDLRKEINKRNKKQRKLKKKMKKALKEGDTDRAENFERRMEHQKSIIEGMKKELGGTPTERKASELTQAVSDKSGMDYDRSKKHFEDMINNIWEEEVIKKVRDPLLGDPNVTYKAKTDRAKKLLDADLSQRAPRGSLPRTGHLPLGSKKQRERNTAEGLIRNLSPEDAESMFEEYSSEEVWKEMNRSMTRDGIRLHDDTKDTLTQGFRTALEAQAWEERLREATEGMNLDLDYEDLSMDLAQGRQQEAFEQIKKSDKSSEVADTVLGSRGRQTTYTIPAEDQDRKGPVRNVKVELGWSQNAPRKFQGLLNAAVNDNKHSSKGK